MNVITHRTYCQYCKTEFNTAISKSKDDPKEGAWAVCLDCRGIGKFNEQLHIRPLTDKEWVRLALSPVMLFKLLEIADYMKKHR